LRCRSWAEPNCSIREGCCSDASRICRGSGRAIARRSASSPRLRKPVETSDRKTSDRLNFEGPLGAAQSRPVPLADLTFMALGGGREIGANSFYYGINGHGMLVDAGLHPEKTGWDAFPKIDALNGSRVDSFFVTHAHTD